MGAIAAAAGGAEAEMVADLLTAGRIAGWDRRLAELVAREQRAPFAWGGHDCATLALRAVHAVTGEDLGRIVRPWFSPVSALRSLKAAGAASAADFFAARFAEIAPASARRGDLVYADWPSDPLACPAVLTGAEAMSRSEAGWIVFPRARVTRAYRIG